MIIFNDLHISVVVFCLNINLEIKQSEDNLVEIHLNIT